MPFAGLGLHILAAIFFAVHVIRSGQNMYWLLILFMFPLLGSVVYFLAIYLPSSRLEHSAHKAIAVVAKALDPTRELREAQDAYEYTPTAQNQMRLAAALFDAGNPKEAAKHYEACLQGPFASDLEMRLGAARALHACGRFPEAIQHLEGIRLQNPDFRSEQVSLLLAQLLAIVGRRQDAKSEFESAVARFGSFAAKAEYFIWAVSAGESETAASLQIDIQHSVERWNRHTRELNMPLLRRLDAAYATVKGRS